MTVEHPCVLGLVLSPSVSTIGSVSPSVRIGRDTGTPGVLISISSAVGSIQNTEILSRGAINPVEVVSKVRPTHIPGCIDYTGITSNLVTLWCIGWFVFPKTAV